MVAVCAFLIILVILFGVEAVRSFVFGTLGVIGWIIAGFLALAAIISIVELYAEDHKASKKAAAERKAADAAAMAKLQKENPKEYKKTIRRGRLGLIFILSFVVIFFGLLAALIISAQQK